MIVTTIICDASKTALAEAAILGWAKLAPLRGYTIPISLCPGCEAARRHGEHERRRDYFLSLARLPGTVP